MNKVVANADEAIRDVFEGASVMIGGFGLCGMPENLIRALVRKGTKNLHTISNNVGIDGVGNGLLLAAGQIVHHIGTYVGENKLLEELVLTGKIKLELVPQGTFSERIRAGGAGIPAFFTPTGVGTIVAEGKEAREFDGRLYLMERGLTADFAFIKAWKGDRAGNLIYRKTARNFNPMMATAAKITIAEVEHLVDAGNLEADAVHTPSIYVKRIFQGERYERRIERRTVRKAGAPGRTQ
jgi:3-oxoacid CoA-transferase subunit A